MKGIGVRFKSCGNLAEDMELLYSIVAISPCGQFYTSYDRIPAIPRPSFLMVKDALIIIDGWVVQMKLQTAFPRFIQRLSEQWCGGGEQANRQLRAFIEAVEAEVARGKLDF